MIKRKFVRALAILLAVIFVGVAYSTSTKKASPIALEASAAGSGYEMSDEYKSSKFYKNLTSISLSGDGARDVVAIAMSQVGYHEGDSEDDFGGESKTGTRDFVEYNVLYGKLDNAQGNGMSYGYYWCASFVNWCLRRAGIPESATAGDEVSCHRWFADCKKAGIYKSKSGYIPKLGDIIFFKDKGGVVDSTHVGIVRYSDGNYVYTVEGNTSNGSDYSSNGEYVALKSHALSSSYIVGYAIPKYNENKTSRTVDYSGSFLSLGDYISEGERQIFLNEELTVASGRSIPAFSVFRVTKIEKDHLKVSYDGLEGYVSRNENETQITTVESVYAINYVNDDGTPIYMPQYRLAGQEKKTYSNSPTKKDCGFVGWRLSFDGEKIISSGDKVPVCDGDVTLTAVWDSNVYTVLFNNSDGSVFYQTSGYYGDEYDVPTPPAAPDGFVFYGWGGEVSGRIEGNATYTATFISEEELKASAATETESNTTDGGCKSALGGAMTVTVTAIIGLAVTIKKKRK